MIRKLRLFLPRLELSDPRPTRPSDWVAFWIGTGLGSGLLRPASGTWGSLAGLIYLYAWSRIPSLALQIVALLLLHVVSIWAAGRCEKLFQRKDPKSVVIDEIAPLPFGFWPLFYFGESRWWMWVAAFGLYRLADILKPFPARRLEALGGGLGIVIDDVVTAIYTGLLLFAWEHFTLGHP